MRTYEVLFILSPQVTEEEAKATVDEFRGVAEKTGAHLKNERKPGAAADSPIPSRSSARATTTSFALESDASMAELDRRMKNSDRIIRHIIVRTDPDQKRADKLAKRNPKKERVRPTPAFTGEPAPEITAVPTDEAKA